MFGAERSFPACMKYSWSCVLMAFLGLQNDVRNSSLQLASMEQRKADENVLRLVEEQKVWYYV